MPDTLVIELARQVPGTVCVILTVLMFIRFLLKIGDHVRAAADRVDAEQRRRDSLMRDQAEACHAFQRDIAERTEQHLARVAGALDRNTDNLVRNTVALERLDRGEKGAKDAVL